MGTAQRNINLQNKTVEKLGSNYYNNLKVNNIHNGPNPYFNPKRKKKKKG